MKTLPWIRDNAMNNLRADQNIIILNDFIDGATTHTAYLMSKARFTGETSIPPPSSPPHEILSFVEPAATAAAVPDTQAAVDTFPSAATLQTKAEADFLVAQNWLSFIELVTSNHTLSLATKEQFTVEEGIALEVLKAVGKEAEDMEEAQEEVLALARRYVEASTY